MEQNNLLISIIVPVYNVDAYLPACLDSILAQIYQNIEIILVDDGSTDKSALICNQYAQLYHNITVISQTNAGLSAARNSGIKKAKGEYIMFVDSDDELENPSLIFDNITLFESDTDFVQFPIRKLFIKENRTEILCVHTGKVCSEYEYLSNILPLYKNNKINGSVCNKIFRRSVFENYMFKDGILHEDSIFMLDISSRFYHVKFSNIGYYDYYIRGGSINTSKHSFRWYSDYMNMQLYYYKKSSQLDLNKNVKLNNYMAMINTLKMAYVDLSDSEVDELIKKVELVSPRLFEFFKSFGLNPILNIKLLVIRCLGLK